MSILKQLVAWVTASKRKYRYDIFYSARVKVGYYLLLWGAMMAIALYVFITYFIQHILTASSRGAIERTSLEILFDDWLIQVVSIFALILFMSALCAYQIMKAALRPISEAFNLQKRFVSGIAHELRTPLSVLRLNNELARLSLPEDSEMTPLFDENMTDIDRITETLSTLLNYDRLLRAPALQFELVNIRKILIVVNSRLAELAKQKDIDLLITPAPTKDIEGNQAALEQAFFNIIENAIAYSPSGSDIFISCIEHASSIVVSIKDSGVGIPQHDLHHIFEPFYRSEKTGKLSGIGIGLAMVEQVIRLHKGDIKVTSVEGNGTEFILSFPLPTHTTK